MTKREAAIVAAHTGCLIGDLSEMHKYIESVMQKHAPLHDHNLWHALKTIYKADFIAISITE